MISECKMFNVWIVSILLCELEMQLSILMKNENPLFD